MLLAEAGPGASKLAVMNGIVDTYNAWGVVERTLLTDMDRLLASSHGWSQSPFTRNSIRKRYSMRQRTAICCRQA